MKSAWLNHCCQHPQRCVSWKILNFHIYHLCHHHFRGFWSKDERASWRRVFSTTPFRGLFDIYRMFQFEWFYNKFKLTFRFSLFNWKKKFFCLKKKKVKKQPICMSKILIRIYFRKPPLHLVMKTEYLRSKLRVFKCQTLLESVNCGSKSWVDLNRTLRMFSSYYANWSPMQFTRFNHHSVHLVQPSSLENHKLLLILF